MVVCIFGFESGWDCVFLWRKVVVWLCYLKSRVCSWDLVEFG